jgi:fructose-1,6-bisphosphatase
MHKAVYMIQLKLEGQAIARHPEYNMGDRRLLHRIEELAADELPDDAETNPCANRYALTLPDGTRHVMNEWSLPTWDANDPYALSVAENEVLLGLRDSFRHCDRLQRHVSFLFSAGSLYHTTNSLLLVHACVPTLEDGSFRQIPVRTDGSDPESAVKLAGRALYDRLDAVVREAFFLPAYYCEAQVQLPEASMLFSPQSTPRADASGPHDGRLTRTGSVVGLFGHPSSGSHPHGFEFGLTADSRAASLVNLAAAAAALDLESPVLTTAVPLPEAAFTSPTGSMPALLTPDTLRERKQYAMDTLWWLWCGPTSPLFGRARMATAERYWLTDKSTWTEPPDPYYTHRTDADFCKRVLAEFGCVDTELNRARIVSGHVPVKIIKGQSPVLASGRLVSIDGGMSRAYQSTTGVAGFTLISNSRNLLLACHKPFLADSSKAAMRSDLDVESSLSVVHKFPRRRLVRDTDTGFRLAKRIGDLKTLISAYQGGELAY